MQVGYAGAALAGMLSFLSPCVLPLVIPYLGFLGGVTLRAAPGGAVAEAPDRGRVLLAALFFVLGFATVFTLLGATASALSQMLAEYLDTLAIIAGIVLILFGLHVAGLLRIGALNYEKRLQAKDKPVSPLGAYDAESDRFLILDTSRYKAPPVWVRTADLFAAMAEPTRDGGRTRGFLLVRKPTIVQSAAAPLARLFDPAGLEPAAALEPVQHGVERGDVEPDGAGGAGFDELRQFVAMPGAVRQQREDEQLRAAFLEFTGGHRASYRGQI